MSYWELFETKVAYNKWFSTNNNKTHIHSPLSISVYPLSASHIYIYVAFSTKLSEIINNEVKQKLIVIPASRLIEDPWIINGLITSSRSLN